jgi:hypothetical protein
MTPEPPSLPRAAGGRRPVSLALLGLLAAATVLFAAVSAVPWIVGFAIAAGGVGGTVALRSTLRPGIREIAAVPALGALVVLAAGAPSTPTAELLGGVVPIALLAWLADDPRRTSGGVGRAAPALILVLLAVAIAWSCAFLLPPGQALVGFGSALLVVATILVAVLLGRPDLIDREPPATA